MSDWTEKLLEKDWDDGVYAELRIWQVGLYSSHLTNKQMYWAVPLIVTNTGITALNKTRVTFQQSTRQVQGNISEEGSPGGQIRGLWQWLGTWGSFELVAQGPLGNMRSWIWMNEKDKAASYLGVWFPRRKESTHKAWGSTGLACWRDLSRPSSWSIMKLWLLVGKESRRPAGPIYEPLHIPL